MATHLRDDTSIETAADVVDAIAAALEADPETAELAPSWTALVTRGDGIAGELRGARRVARRARSVVAVRDAIWDIVIKGFDRAALDHVGGHKLSPTYQQWWRSGTSAEVTRFGTDREVGFGEGVIALLTPLLSITGSLAPEWLPKITDANGALSRASSARREAVTAIGPFLTAQFLYVEDVNLEIDRVEGQLQIKFPGDPKRVASYLMATRRDTAGVPDAAPAAPPAGAPPPA